MPETKAHTALLILCNELVNELNTETQQQAQAESLELLQKCVLPF